MKNNCKNKKQRKKIDNWGDSYDKGKPLVMEEGLYLHVLLWW